MPCDLITPQSVNVSAVVEKLQSSYPESLNACSGVKMQQYLHLSSEVNSASYTTAACLQAVGGWRQRKHLAQLRSGSHLLAVGTGRNANARVERAQRLCLRCDAISFDEVSRMIFDCVALDVERQKHHPVFVCTWMSCFSSPFYPGPNTIDCFCARLLQGLRNVIWYSVHLWIFSSSPTCS